MAIWHDGEPANLEAAAEDAYQWLAFTQSRAPLLKMSAQDWDSLDRCMEAIRGFLPAQTGEQNDV